MSDMLKKYDYAWTADGRKVYIEAITQDGEYVVSGLFAQIYGDEIEEEKGERWIHNGRLYPKAPVQVLDEEMVAKRAEITKLNLERTGLMSSARNAEREIEERLKKLAKYKGLERLEAFIDGKITHFVVLDYSGANIKTFDELAVYRSDERRNPEGVKLLTLFGDSKGDLSWRLDQYRSASSSDMEVIPCTSEEEAIRLRDARLVFDLEEAMKPACPGEHKGEEHRRFHVMRAAGKMKQVGLPVPEEAEAIAFIELESRRAAERTRILTNLAQAQKQLDELETKEVL